MKIVAVYFHFIDKRYRYEGKEKYGKGDKLLKHSTATCIHVHVPAFYASIKDLTSERIELS